MPGINSVYLKNLAVFLRWSPGPKYREEAYFVRNTGDETLDIQLSWTRLLTWSICTFQTSSSFTQSCSFTQGGVLYIIKVLL